MYAGIEAGGTKVVCTVGTGPDDLVASASFPTTTPAETLGRAIDFVRGQPAIDAIGVASFGPVDLREGSATYGTITSTPKPGWRDIDVVGPLRSAFGVPVGFDSDVNGAALGEHRWGAARGLDTFVYVTLGTGVGAGGMAGGQLLHGALHPEMGHLDVRRHPDDGYEGSCPFHGDCLEGLASGPAVAARWGRPGTELGADLGPAVTIEAWYLAQLVLAVTYVLSPRRVIVGGGVAKLPGLFAATHETVERRLAGYVDVPEVRDLAGYVVPPGLGDRAGVLGAIALAERAADAQRPS